MKTIIIILSKDREELTDALTTCHDLLGSLNVENYNDGYPIIMYNKELTVKEKEIISTELYNKYSCYLVFLECSNDAIKETSNDLQNLFYVNAILCGYGKNS